MNRHNNFPPDYATEAEPPLPLNSGMYFNNSDFQPSNSSDYYLNNTQYYYPQFDEAQYGVDPHQQYYYYQASATPQYVPGMPLVESGMSASSNHNNQFVNNYSFVPNTQQSDFKAAQPRTEQSFNTMGRRHNSGRGRNYGYNRYSHENNYHQYDWLDDSLNSDFTRGKKGRGQHYQKNFSRRNREYSSRDQSFPLNSDPNQEFYNPKEKPVEPPKTADRHGQKNMSGRTPNEANFNNQTDRSSQYYYKNSGNKTVYKTSNYGSGSSNQIDHKSRKTNFSKNKIEDEKSGNTPKNKQSSGTTDQRGSLTEQLSRGTYECMVCCDSIRVDTAVWNCDNCYHVFHLYCIKKWVNSSIDEKDRTWRCPGCQNISNTFPNKYLCFCGKQKNPTYVRGETPHSCGEVCKKKKRIECNHPCTLLCHPGPCPSCSSMVSLSCDCGRIQKMVLCSAANRFKCDKVCGKELNCGKHKCEELCHSGPCKQCMIFDLQECFCKKNQRKIHCGTAEFKTTAFCCDAPCGKTLSCGNHVCEETCHPGDCPPCPLTPGLLSKCSCGKTLLEDLKIEERISCLDPLPTCGQICNKQLFCGPSTEHHRCEKVCHEGECGPCKQRTKLKCECGACEKEMPCEVAISYDDNNPFKCQKRCGKRKTCGKHKCSEVCCVRDIHICEFVCGKKLNCGLHKCEELCHKGNCKKCLQACFDELMCYCGAEVIEPPVPCGTKLPACSRPCSRQHSCDHPVRHTCHSEDQCPPCTDLVEKLCMGGHVIRKNIPCHRTDISCGLPCDKLLPCEVHKCQRICHKSSCLEETKKCTQACPKPRELCGHPCSAPCHQGPCPITVCKFEITITCACGNKSTRAACNLGGDKASELAMFQRLNVQNIAQSAGQAVDMSQFSRLKKSNKRLECDTNCAMLERNKRLALALEIKNPDINAKLGKPTYTDFLKDFAKNNPRFALDIEQKLKSLVETVNQGSQSSKSHSFPVMNRDKRRFVHEMGELFGCQTQSFDFEPNKNVVATANKGKCWLPNASLGAQVLKDQLPKGLTSLTSMKTQGVSFTVMEKKPSEETGKVPSKSRGWEQKGAAWSQASSSSTGTNVKPKQQTKTSQSTIDYFDFSSS